MVVQDKKEKQKTYKREIAVVLLIYIMVTGYIGDFRVLEVVTWPFLVYVMAAFGFDAYTKQIPQSSPHPIKNRSSKYENWEEK